MNAVPPVGNLPGATLGAIAVAMPGATGVLRRFGLDFCCGGDATLADAAGARGVPVQEVIAALAALPPDAAPAAPSEPNALVDYILERYHAAHRRELPELIRMAQTVERVHAANPEVPAGLGVLLAEIAQELEMHMQKEELVLFPLMKSGRGAFAGPPIARMRMEHDEHGERLRALAALTHDGVVPAGACTTWRALYAGTAHLIDALMEHIHLENNVLFPQFGGPRPPAAA